MDRLPNTPARRPAAPPPQLRSYWDPDPALDVLDVLRAGSIRTAAYRLFSEGRIDKLETLLMIHGVLSPDGRVNTGRFPQLVERIDEIETDEEAIATLSHDYGFNQLCARRRGWTIEYVLRQEGGESVERESTVPLSDEEVIGILENSGLLDYLRESGADGCYDPEDLRGSWLWTSAGGFHTTLDDHFLDDESYWIDTLIAEREEGDDSDG
jgi:hypothetical protein